MATTTPTPLAANPSPPLQSWPPYLPNFQVPPINPLESALLTFSTSGVAFIKVAATGTNGNFPGSGSGPYRQNTEYWYANTASISSVTDVTMTLHSAAITVDGLKDFFSAFAPAFTVGEDVSSGVWEQGQYEPASANTARLFKAPDPDDASTFIGLLIAQDQGDNLQAIAWYKTCQPKHGWIWRPGKPPTSELQWSLVTDSTGAPTIDPTFMQSDKTWYFIAQS